TEESTFEALEKDIQEVLNELLGDEKFEKFRVEYEKIAKALRKSHENEKRLMSKCRELNAEIMSNTVKVSTAMKLADEDQATITSLKMEIDKAWKMVEASHAKELQMKEEEVTQLKQEITKLTKMREGVQRRLRQMEEQKVEVENQRETLKNQITGLDREMETAKKQMDMDKKAIDELVRERDILNKVLENIEDIKLKEMHIFEYKKRIAEAETKLKQQQNLYEDVRTERNLFSKNLIEAKDQNAEMKRKVKIVNHMFEQLKDEITTKEVALDKERQEFQRVERERENLKAELQKMRQQAQETKQFIEKQEAEERELLKIIAEADAERIRQKKELDQVRNERDLLGMQLMKRNEALALLYEKIKIQHSIMNKGDIQYNERLEDIRLLKLEIKKQRREKNILNKTVSNVEDLRHEVFHMQRELLKERTRCRALEDELGNPLNVHRWRKLEASDPSSFELIQKIHSLQRRLIAKTQEVVEKELMLQEKEKLYVELKHILARQPGPEAAEKLQVYQRTLREKTKQLKVLTAELNMHESQSEDYKYEIERLAHELQEVKKKYLAQKRKDQEHREKERNLTQAGQPVIQPQRPDGARFTGGGFSFKQHNRMALQALEQQS
ncbi:cilia- and flagella-associated protein 58, partial [Sinocyclocheilus grahami]